MALTFNFEEEYRNSRQISVSEQSFQQTFSFYLCGNFYDEAKVDATYGPDDDIVALNAAYSITPTTRSMPLYAGGYILLTLSDLKLDQIDPETWKVTVTYSPRPIDQSPGGTGPAVGDRGTWTNNFVQLGFNVTAQQEQKSMSMQLVDIKKNTGFGNQNVPYTVGRRTPVGHTIDGVEGAPVYVRAFSFTITAYFSPQQLTFAYVRRLYRMATTLNNKSFFGFPAGSVLFLEASAAGDLHRVVPVTFAFEMRPNFKLTATGVDTLMDPDVDDEALMFDQFVDPYFPVPTATTPFPGNAFSGWSTMDYRYLSTVDDTAKMALQKPVLRLIHKQYETSNFDKFEI